MYTRLWKLITKYMEENSRMAVFLTSAMLIWTIGITMAGILVCIIRVASSSTTSLVAIQLVRFLSWSSAKSFSSSMLLRSIIITRFFLKINSQISSNSLTKSSLE